MGKNKTLARELVERFGDPEHMAELYADDVSWKISKSLGKEIAGPHVGRESVIALHKQVWEEFYDPAAIEIEILDEIGDADHGVVRFTYRTRFRGSGHPYENEYVLFAKGSGGKISEIVEALDTLSVQQQFAAAAESQQSKN